MSATHLLNVHAINYEGCTHQPSMPPSELTFSELPFYQKHQHHQRLLVFHNMPCHSWHNRTRCCSGSARAWHKVRPDRSRCIHAGTQCIGSDGSIGIWRLLDLLWINDWINPTLSTLTQITMIVGFSFGLTCWALPWEYIWSHIQVSRSSQVCAFRGIVKYETLSKGWGFLKS